MAIRSFAEAFIRAYAERAVKAIEITIDKDTGIALLTFHNRRQRVFLRDLVLQDEAFRRLGVAVDFLLGIPEQAETEAITPIQLTPERST